MTLEQFNKIFEQNWLRLVYFCHNMLKDIDNAKDIAAATITEAWNKHNDKSAEHFVGILYITARSRCLNEIRRQKMHATHLNNLPINDNFIETKIQESYLISSIYKAVKEFSPRKRAIFLMKYRDGLMCSQIGKILGINKSTVTTQVSASINELKNFKPKTMTTTEKFVLAHYEYLTVSDMADELNESVNAIDFCCRKLGIKPIKRGQQIINFINDHRHKPVEWLAERLNVAPSQVVRYLTANNITLINKPIPSKIDWTKYKLMDEIKGYLRTTPVKGFKDKYSQTGTPLTDELRGVITTKRV